VKSRGAANAAVERLFTHDAALFRGVLRSVGRVGGPGGAIAPQRHRGTEKRVGLALPVHSAMRRPGVRFWRAVFAASVILFVAGVIAAAAVSGPPVYTQVSPTNTVVYGGGLVGVVWINTRLQPSDPSFVWAIGLDVTSVPGSPPKFRWRPRHRWNEYYGLTAVPAKYVWMLPLLTGLGAAFILHRHKKRNAAALCAGCGYSLAGLPADAAACPECGGKIGKSTTEARRLAEVVAQSVSAPRSSATTAFTPSFLSAFLGASLRPPRSRRPAFDRRATKKTYLPSCAFKIRMHRTS